MPNWIMFVKVKWAEFPDCFLLTQTTSESEKEPRTLWDITPLSQDEAADWIVRPGIKLGMLYTQKEE